MSNLELDTSEVEAMFSEFDAKKRKSVYRQATRQALNIVKKQTLENLKGVINPKVIGKKDKWGNSFRTGVSIKVYKSAKAGGINIMKNFKMRFFENGTFRTGIRYAKTWRGQPLKKDRKTGEIKAYHYFKSALTSKEAEVFNSIDTLISNSIKKINEKYKGKKL